MTKGPSNLSGSKQAELKDYIAAFGDPTTEAGTYMKDSRLAKAYEVALDIRKFEIELYWKRSTNFWLLLGGIGAVLGFVAGGRSDVPNHLMSTRLENFACLGLSMAGATISWAWWLVNKGSKFWQRNWEYQVQILESDILGPLYKTVFADKENKVMYSVSGLNEYISICFMLLFGFSSVFFFFGKEGISWGLQRLHSLPLMFRPDGHLESFIYLLKVIFIIGNLLLVWLVLRRVRNERKTNVSNFDVYADASVRKVHLNRVFANGEERARWASPRRWSSSRVFDPEKIDVREPLSIVDLIRRFFAKA